MSNESLLENKEVVRWCYEPLTAVSLITPHTKLSLKAASVQEVAWANLILGRVELKQWTTTLAQNVAKEALTKLGRKHVRRVRELNGAMRAKKYSPDWECDEYVYEVKARSWTTPGTAGEKILGVPLKYGEVPRLYGKPLQIILVGYQEYEARTCFQFGDLLDSEQQTPELKDSLAFFKTKNIEYVAFTDILKQIQLPYGCWNKSK